MRSIRLLIANLHVFIFVLVLSSCAETASVDAELIEASLNVDVIDTSIDLVTSPANNQQLVPTNLTNVSVSFNTEIDPDSISIDNLSVIPAIAFTMDKTNFSTDRTIVFIMQNELQVETTYTLMLENITDLQGNLLDDKTWSFTTGTVTSIEDVTPPTSPDNLVHNTSSLTSHSIELLWSQSLDEQAGVTYNVIRNDLLIASTSETMYLDNTLEPGTSYIYYIQAVDIMGNTSTGNSYSITSLKEIDTEQPSTPANFRVDLDSITASSLQLLWGLSTDNVATTGYVITRDGTELGIINGSSYIDSGLSPETTYLYSIIAYDDANNSSNISSLTFTTPALADLQMPSVLTVSPADSAIDVSPSLNQIIVDFDESMDPNSVNQSSFTLNNGLTGTVEMLNDNTRAVFTPSQTLSSGMTYTATLNGMTDAAGNDLQDNIEYSWSFSTCGADAGATYTVSWDAVNDADVSGYKLYYATTSQLSKASTSFIQVDNVTSWVIDPSSLGVAACETLYIALAATGFTKDDSSLSNVEKI